jgi:hypothetical protein
MKQRNLNDLSVAELKALYDQGLIDLEDIPEFQDWKRMNQQSPDWVNPYPQRKRKEQ